MDKLFILKGGTLVVKADLDASREDEFEAACDRLLRARAKKLALDLKAIKFICSPCLAEIFYVYYQAKKAGKTLTIRAPRALETVFSVANIGKLMKVEMV